MPAARATMKTHHSERKARASHSHKLSGGICGGVGKVGGGPGAWSGAATVTRAGAASKGSGADGELGGVSMSRLLPGSTSESAPGCHVRVVGRIAATRSRRKGLHD